MPFNSPQFIFFFILSVSIYAVWPNRSKWIPLLVASYFFYINWELWFVLILFLSTLLTYGCALLIDKSSDRRSKKVFLFLCVASNLGLLFFYKYVNFINESIRSLFTFAGANYTIPYFNIIFPIGISFYTFQAISYGCDVFFEKQRVEKHLGFFAVYLSFFPKLISGPIERASNLIHQLKSDRRIRPDKIASGAGLMLFGLFKKMVIADRLAMYVNMVFSHPHDFTGQTLILAAWFFTLQIYCDLSAYTDIAIGCGRIMGIELTRNFDFPYFARSIADFWRKWHITLTSWFRDYLYIPLGGNRVKYGRWLINIMAVFLLSGLWHGANWTFLTWGALHGIYYLFGKATTNVRQNIYKKLNIHIVFRKMLQVFVTFNLVAIAWVFFKASSISDAIYVITHMFRNLTEPFRLGPSAFTTIVTISWAFVFCGIETLRYIMKKHEITFHSIPFGIRCPVYCCTLLSIFLFGISTNKFIYFHF